MTYEELRKQILNLGFETADTYDEDPTIITDAINRAMREITNMFPLIGKYKIAQNPLTNLLDSQRQNMDIRHYDGKASLKFTATGARSIYFECSGTGTLTIQDDDGERSIALIGKRAFQDYRAFVKGSVTLTFGGPYSYDIKNVAVYGEAYSDQLTDIPPYRQYVRYDFKALTAVNGAPVFIDFLDKVQEGDYSSGNSYVSIKDFQVEQRHILLLDGLKKVEYTVFFRKNFTQFTANTPSTFVIELDSDKEHLLPLLAAWYVWADDEPTKAAKWKNDYEDFTALLLNTAKPQTAQVAFLNELGW